MGDYIYPRWKGVDVKPSLSADREMRRLGLYLDDVLTHPFRGKGCVRVKEREGDPRDWDEVERKDDKGRRCGNCDQMER